MKLPRRILIANRGEIAVRVARTCAAMGIETVVVHTEADVGSPHIDVGTIAIQVSSYVDADGLCEAARRGGADAVHPGYGFLAENADFVRAVEDAGLVFIGPPASAMEVMGSKARARDAMHRAGVPVVPGTPPGTADELAEAAEAIGFPVFLKAVAGGGGKGMSIVDDAAALQRVFRQAAEEAQRSFGDDAIYLEKVIARPRHIEIQIFADGHGNTVALGERECSIQRRHQKIVEEAPSAAVGPELRERMSAAAVAAAAAVGYVGAGTIEFLLEGSGEFYFLEMNTRLQVEHPVTEWITGLDLVQLQIEVAAGAELPPDARTPTFLGHALECRVYAEDPATGHLPQAGRLLLLREPSGPGIRVDSALAEGQEIGVHFDPMLAKLSCWGPDRGVAIDRMREALRRYVVLGLRTNLEHLQDILDIPSFVAGDLSTAFLDDHMADWTGTTTVPDLALAGSVLARRPGSSEPGADRTATSSLADPWNTVGAFRVGTPGPDR